MTTYGLTTDGFNPKTLAVVKAELEDAFKSVFGASIDLDPAGPLGQIIGIVAERLAEVWDAAQEVYVSFDPDEATGEALDALCALTGTLREAAAHSTVTVTCTGTAGTTIPEGTQFSVSTTGVKFETLAEATMDGTFTTVDIDCQSVDTGPLPALAGTLTVIETPVDGLTAVTNASDADLGSYEETDAELRLRREEEIRTNETGSLEAIREAVLGVDGVDECVVFENVSMVTDGDGIPAKAINVVVDPGTATDADIAEAIFGSVAAGIETYGTDKSATVADTQGTNHTIEWDEADQINCYVTATITYDADHWPVDGSTQAQTLILAYESSSRVMGKDLVGRALGAEIFKGVEGVLDCVVLVGTTNPPASASVTIGLREIAALDSARITITASAGTP
jgi:uncharacterized phage protein gp47/JayE